MMMPDSFRTATLFPDAAIRVKRLAEPFICVVMEENVSDYMIENSRLVSLGFTDLSSFREGRIKGREGGSGLSSS